MRTNLTSLILIGALTMGISACATDGDSVKTELSDSVITTKIKAEFAKDKAVSATNVSVDTNANGMVTLSGKTKTKAEADRAVSIAKSTQGVKSVKSEIVVE